MTTRWVVAATAVLLLATGCSSEEERYNERMDFLRHTANRGVEAHRLLSAQDADITKARCERAFDGLMRGESTPDAPNGTLKSEEDWEAQVKEFFADSCVSGKPKPVPGDKPAPEPSESPSTSVSPSPS